MTKDEEIEFAAKVKNQIELIKSETKAFATKIVDLHLAFAGKNMPALVGEINKEENIKQAKERLTNEILEALGYDKFEAEITAALNEIKQNGRSKR